MSEFKFIKTIVIITVIAVCFVLYGRHMESRGYSEANLENEYYNEK